MRGILYGIGVGPGDPELMTIQAINRIKDSDVIILPSAPKENCYAYRIVEAVLPEIKEKEIICMSFLMTKNKEDLISSHNKIYQDISLLLDKEKAVAFLTIGDPSIYSTYSYIHRREIENGGKAIMVSGVPSFCAAASALGISLGDNKEQIHIIPASYEVENTLSLKGTKVYMKSGKKLSELKEILKKADSIDESLVYGISNCGMVNEKIMIGLDNIDDSSGYLTIVIVKEMMESLS